METEREQDQFDRLLKINEVTSLVGLGKSAIYDMMAAGAFPAIVKIGCASRWSLLEVQQWIEARKRERAA